jgi:isopenicillin N synthase-like dioxygenase
MAAAQETIPVLDLGSARRTDGSFNPEFIEELRDATHRVGFFQVIGYGGAPGQATELLATIKRFFALPLEERMKLDNRLSPHFRGYTRMGTEVTQGRADAREQIDYSPDREPVKN